MSSQQSHDPLGHSAALRRASIDEWRCCYDTVACPAVGVARRDAFIPDLLAT